MRKKKTKEEWIADFKEAHSDKYDYSLMNTPKNNVDKIKIVCRVHGIFHQSPADHRRGKGCKRCGVDKRSISQRTTSEDFFKRVSEAHDNKYTYPKKDYIGLSKKITVECPVHGEFEQIASNHLAGKGCRKCFHEKNAKARTRFDTSSFIEHCSKVHNNFYDYSLTSYTAARNSVSIVCPVHGAFEQDAQAHYEGHGCYECAILNRRHVGGFGDKIRQWAESNISDTPAKLYLLRMVLEGDVELLKFGITTDTMDRRISGIKCDARAMYIDVVSYWPMPLNKAYGIEQRVKDNFKSNWHNPIRRFHGWTECLENISEQEVIHYIEELV